MRLDGHIAVITGAGSGIGRATAERFAAEGACVGINDVDDTAAQGTVERIEAAGGEALLAPGNVTDIDAVTAMFDAVLRRWGRVDVLVNNAGITRDALMVKVKNGQVGRMAEGDWDDVLGVNLKGTFLCCQAAAVPMIRQGSGRIVNTASVSAFGNIGQANYAASKAGVIGLTRTLALELARHGIRVNCIAPGAVATPMTAGIPEQLKDRLVAQIPFGRMAEPEEIAAVHLFLASDEASYVTGQCIVVDAGLRL